MISRAVSWLLELNVGDVFVASLSAVITLLVALLRRRGQGE